MKQLLGDSNANQQTLRNWRDADDWRSNLFVLLESMTILEAVLLLRKTKKGRKAVRDFQDLVRSKEMSDNRLVYYYDDETILDALKIRADDEVRFFGRKD